MTIAHILGLPVEESIVQLAPACAAIVTALALAARTRLDRLRPRTRRPETLVAASENADAMFATRREELG